MKNRSERWQKTYNATYAELCRGWSRLTEEETVLKAVRAADTSERVLEEIAAEEARYAKVEAQREADAILDREAFRRADARLTVMIDDLFMADPSIPLSSDEMRANERAKCAFRRAMSLLIGAANGDGVGGVTFGSMAGPFVRVTELDDVDTSVFPQQDERRR